MQKQWALVESCMSNVLIVPLAAHGGSPGFQAGDEVEKTAGFSPGLGKSATFVRQVPAGTPELFGLP
jgi:hypothetical protein